MARTDDACIITTSAPQAHPVPFSTVTAAHAGLIERLAVSKPHEIRYVADARDLEDRAAHVQAIGNAVIAYLTEIVADTAENANGIDCDVCRGLIDDISDIVGNFTNVAEDIREYGRAA
jgi:hypothetical protein